MDNWSLDPFILVASFVALWHERGLRHLALRSTPGRNRTRRLRSIFFYCALALLVLTVISPLDYWAGAYYWVHMVQHLLLMFAVPSLVVAGAPWLPLVHGLPVAFRRRLLRGLLVATWSRPLRAVGRWLLRPWTAVVLFNAVMVCWHLPALFDFGERNQTAHVWLMHGSFLLVGVLFWLQFIPSYPARLRLDPVGQIAALLLTNTVMFLLAISQSFFSATVWYPVYAHVPGVSLSPYADQQIGAAILWICGDLWCYPALVVAVRRLMASDGFDRSFDRLLRRESHLLDFERGPTPRG